MNNLRFCFTATIIINIYNMSFKLDNLFSSILKLVSVYISNYRYHYISEHIVFLLSYKTLNWKCMISKNINDIKFSLKNQ